MKKIILLTFLLFYVIQINAISNGVYKSTHVRSVENMQPTPWEKHDGTFILDEEFLNIDDPMLGKIFFQIQERKKHIDPFTKVEGIVLDCIASGIRYIVTFDNADGFIKMIMLQPNDPQNTVLSFKLTKIMNID